jgi:transcriptional regulator with XRE-family HTH domain
MDPTPAAQQVALGAAIKATRKSLGYSQEGFALRCGLDRSHFGKIERGQANMTLTVLEKIAAELQLSPSELLKRAGR